MWSAKLVFQGNEDLFNTPECSWIFWTGTCCRSLSLWKPSPVWVQHTMGDLIMLSGFLVVINHCDLPSNGYREHPAEIAHARLTVCLVFGCPTSFSSVPKLREWRVYPPVADGYPPVSQGRGTDLLAGADLCRNTWQRMIRKSLEISNRWYSCVFFGFTLW